MKSEPVKTCIEQLEEKESVLTWASDNVMEVKPCRFEKGVWECYLSGGFWCVGPTLYDSLLQAWKNRDVP